MASYNPTFIGTFRQGDDQRRDSYVRFEAPSEAAARQKMVDAYGQNWSMIYDDSPADPAGIERHGLTKIPMGS